MCEPSLPTAVEIDGGTAPWFTVYSVGCPPLIFPRGLTDSNIGPYAHTHTHHIFYCFAGRVSLVSDEFRSVWSYVLIQAWNYTENSVEHPSQRPLQAVLGLFPSSPGPARGSKTTFRWVFSPAPILATSIRRTSTSGTCMSDSWAASLGDCLCPQRQLQFMTVRPASNGLFVVCLICTQQYMEIICPPT